MIACFSQAFNSYDRGCYGGCGSGGGGGDGDDGDDDDGDGNDNVNDEGACKKTPDLDKYQRTSTGRGTKLRQ